MVVDCMGRLDPREKKKFDLFNSWSLDIPKVGDIFKKWVTF
tara:strand:- start:256 stop:378 length:123 start_codon:yes stop_codon:yes gene_type:complete